MSFSVLDQRPLLKGMCDLCEKHNVKLLTYGSLLGGFLSDRFLNVPAPEISTTSHKKYIKWIIYCCGSWEKFQDFLKFLRGVFIFCYLFRKKYF